jgi:hypothetical protein
MNPIDDRTYKALLDDGITAQGDLIIVRDDLIEGAIDSETIDSSWEQVISTTVRTLCYGETLLLRIQRLYLLLELQMATLVRLFTCETPMSTRLTISLQVPGIFGDSSVLLLKDGR